MARRGMKCGQADQEATLPLNHASPATLHALEQLPQDVMRAMTHHDE